jgi:hypothetical protein
VAQPSPAANSALRTAALSAALFAVNVYVCRELFRIEYLKHMGSIEALFITLARYARDHWGDLAWFPLWYSGVPYQNTYPPLLPMVTSAVAFVARCSPALAYHVVVAFVYCAAPVALFLLCRRLSGATGPSFFAGLLYSVVAPSAFLIADVRRDLGSVLRPRRLQTLVVYGEGPHITGLALLIVSILLLDVAIVKRRPHFYVLAALACAGTALTNWLAAAALSIAVVSYLLAFPGFPSRRAVLATAGVAVLAYAMAASWIPPSTVRTFQFNSQTIEGDYRDYARLLPLRAAAILAALAGAKFLLTRWGAGRALQFGAYFTIVTGAIAIAWEYAKIAVVPQPHRYNTELELGVAVLFPFAVAPLVARTPRAARVAAAIACLIAAIPLAKEHRRYARYIIQPVDMTQRIEYKSARWFDGRLRDGRVLAPGSIAFWMNAFTDTAQLGGADDQGTTDFLTRVATYVIWSSDSTGSRDAEISLAWLKAFGVSAIEVGGANSGEVYKPFRNPSKFAGRLTELWRDGDDIVYEVPARSRSLAHVMRAADLPPRPPINGIDIDPLGPYLAALDDPSAPVASLRWTSQHSAEISAPLKPDQLLSVQVTYDQGWRASVDGRAVKLHADPLGQMVVEPRCDGECTVHLSYNGGLEMAVALTLSWSALAFSAGWIVLGNARRRRASI